MSNVAFDKQFAAFKMVNFISYLYMFLYERTSNGLVGFYGILTVVGYLMPNPLYTYILNMIWFGMVWFYDISTILSYLMSNPLYTYILNIQDLDGLGFRAYQPL